MTSIIVIVVWFTNSTIDHLMVSNILSSSKFCIYRASQKSEFKPIFDILPYPLGRGVLGGK